MKSRHIATIAALALIAWAMTSCVTREVTVTSPDGTVTVTKTSEPAPGSIEAGTAAAQIIAAK